VIIQTTGDRDTRRPFQEIGAPGLFVRQIEQALLEGGIDLAVHSYKDLPSQSPPDLFIAAVPEREAVGDLLVARPEAVAGHGDPHAGVPVGKGARIGTASARRRALLADMRPDVSVELIRGNVPTRLEKLGRGEFDAVILARAGVNRLRSMVDSTGAPSLPLNDFVLTPLDPTVFVPAPAQGALAVQARRDNTAAAEAAAGLDDPVTRRPVETERRLLARIEGGCSLPFGAWCSSADGELLVLRAVLGTDKGLVRVKQEGRDASLVADNAHRQLTGGGKDDPTR
jgi:hydroxymethylbilane synthase